MEKITLTQEDFRKIAVYGNEAWKGCFSEEEVETFAQDYYSEYCSIGESEVLNTLLEYLEADVDIYDGDEITTWIYGLKQRLGIMKKFRIDKYPDGTSMELMERHYGYFTSIPEARKHAEAHYGLFCYEITSVFTGR